MVSGTLAGLLKVGAVALTAGGLATGIYLAVQVGQEEDANRAQTVETPSATSTALSPPNQVVTKPTPTATFPPAPLTPPPDIDTSGWKTYTSPLGFTLKYPPEWTAGDADSAGAVGISNPRAQERATILDPSDPEDDEVFLGGEAWIEVIPDAFPRFDVNELFQVCGVRDQPVPHLSARAEAVTMAGQPAVRCFQEGPAIDRDHRASGALIWISLPTGQVVLLAGQAIDADPATVSLIELIVGTVSFPAIQ